MPSMIFMYTGRLSDDPRSGSAVRPIRMLAAFKELGFDVTEVVGYSAERKRAMTGVRRAIRRGERFEFCYVETTTMPMALGDPGHIPIRPFLDTRFLLYVRDSGIPVFAFYRDAHWRLPGYGQAIQPWKKMAALHFYKKEFFELGRIAKTFFLPFSGMDSFLPNGVRHIAELPPGCEYDPLPRKPRSIGIRMLYVGGVLPPIYDLSEQIEAVDGLPGIELTIVCREHEASMIKARCAPIRNVSIIHKNSLELRSEYAEADIASLFLAPTEYLAFAMPIKLFEAVGYGVPVLARAGTAAADFVAREGVGWVVSGPEEARTLLEHLAANRDEVEVMRAQVRDVAKRHTWLSRARTVADHATAIRQTLGGQG